MAQDLYIDPLTNDLTLNALTGSLELCSTIEQLTRQRVEVTLRTFMGEWFLDTGFGMPYFQSVFGKNTRAAADSAIRAVILSVEGVQSILGYISILNNATRTLIVDVSIQTASGEIINIEVSV